MKTRLSIVLTIIISTLFGVIGGGLSTYTLLTYDNSYSDELDDQKLSVSTFEELSYSEAWQKAAPSVVSIVAKKNLNQFYGQNSLFGVPVQDDEGLTTVSSGSGFIITPDGLIVTNRHVVEDESAEYVVVLNDGLELEAEVLDKDTLNDIALVRITESLDGLSPLPALEFVDSDSLKVGTPVMAIGNALGLYSNTITAGIISAKDRQISVSGPGFGTESLVDLLQTDAAINPGNSGGPLIDLNGNIVGMNTAIDASAEGIGFAIPANDIAAVVTSYQEFGKIVRPFLGVRYFMVNDGVKERFGLDEAYGALLLGDDEKDLPAVIPGSSADEAGLRANDVVLSVEGDRIEPGFTLSNSLLGKQIGEVIKLEVWRDGEVLEINLQLKERN